MIFNIKLYKINIFIQFYNIIIFSGVPKNIGLRKLSLEVYILVITNLKSMFLFICNNIIYNYYD